MAARRKKSRRIRSAEARAARRSKWKGEGAVLGVFEVAPPTPETVAKAKARRETGTVQHMLAREQISEKQARAAELIVRGYWLAAGEVRPRGQRFGAREEAETVDPDFSDAQAELLAHYTAWCRRMMERRRALMRDQGIDGWRQDIILAVLVEGLSLRQAARCYHRDETRLAGMLRDGLDLWWLLEGEV
ncbi:MAG: hypothetical protein Alpg2KO_01070 [Alphaproteobacteria bacterium]